MRRHWKALGKVLHFMFCTTQSLSPGLELCHFTFWYFINMQKFTLMLHIFKVLYSESFIMPRSQMKLQGTTNQNWQKLAWFCNTDMNYTKNLDSFILRGEKSPSKTVKFVCDMWYGRVKIAGESCCSQYCQQTARRNVTSDGSSFSAPTISWLHVHFHLDRFGFKEQKEHQGFWGCIFVTCRVFVVSWIFFWFWFGGGFGAI